MDSRERDRLEHGASAATQWHSIRSPGTLHIALPQHAVRPAGRARHLKLRTLWFLFYAMTVVTLG